MWSAIDATASAPASVQAQNTGDVQGTTDMGSHVSDGIRDKEG